MLQEGVLRALGILCRNHGDTSRNFMERASIGQVAKALDDSDLEVSAIWNALTNNWLLPCKSWLLDCVGQLFDAS